MAHLLFPHPAYAEDQPYSHLILTTHVLHRAFQSGVVLSIPVSSSLHFYRQYRQNRNPSLPTNVAPKPRALAALPFNTKLLRGAGIGGALGIAAFCVGLPAMMWPKEKIEWQDRAWRLLESRGQKEVDELSVVGGVVGAVGLLVRYGGLGSAVRGVGWSGVAGGAGMGNLVGVGVYMAWRYGIQGER